MTATVKKVKQAPAAPVNKGKKAAVVTQIKKAAQTKKVTQVKQAAAGKKTVQAVEIPSKKRPVQAEPVPQIQEAIQAQEVIQAQDAAEMAEAAAMVMPAVEAAPQASAGANVERILLPARMELASLDEAQQLLQSKYPPVYGTYILDGALLSVIDMAGIQMLISFIRSVTEKGSRVEWDNYSVQVYQLASELGVTSQLGD